MSNFTDNLKKLTEPEEKMKGELSDLPQKIKNLFWMSVIFAVFMFFIFLPILYYAEIIQYEYQLTLYIIVVGGMTIWGFAGYDKERKEYIRQKSIDDIANAIRENKTSKGAPYVPPLGDEIKHFCPYCGQTLQEGATFCSFCGKAIK